MALTYPLSMPATRAPRRMRIDMDSVVGVQPAPLTLEQTIYVWQGDVWHGMLEWGEMNRSDAAAVIAFLAALNGSEGTFLAGDPLAATPLGTWGGTPLLNGAHAAGIKTLTVDGFTAAATGKAGDYIQFGSGSTTRLHMVVQDFTADGSGQATLEIWPRLRAALADNTPVVKSATQGLWRLASNVRGYDISDVRISGISVPIIEARDG
jgi:hypothetical protein